ncbi:hypothetical protein D3C85_1149990 [compost metagenome]
MLGVRVDEGGVAGDQRAVLRNHHVEATAVDLVAEGQRVEVPLDAHFHLAFFQVGDAGVVQRQAALLGQRGEEVQRGLQVPLVAAHGIGRGEHGTAGACRGADISQRHLVVALEQVGPGLGRGRHQLVVADEGDGAGIGHRPVAFAVLGPGRNLVPVAWLVRLGHALAHRHRCEGDADVTDIAAGVVLFRFELGDFLRRAQVGVLVLEPIALGQLCPGVFPVGPVVRHAQAVYRALLLGGLDQAVHVLGKRLAGPQVQGGEKQASHQFFHAARPLD